MRVQGQRFRGRDPSKSGRASRDRADGKSRGHEGQAAPLGGGNPVMGLMVRAGDMELSAGAGGASQNWNGGGESSRNGGSEEVGQGNRR